MRFTTNMDDNLAKDLSTLGRYFKKPRNKMVIWACKRLLASFPSEIIEQEKKEKGKNYD